MKILITGGNGFIGSRFLRLLKKVDGAEALGLDIETFDWNKDISLQQADLTNHDKIKSILSSYCPDTIILNAAIKGLENCENNINALKTNVFSMGPFLEYSFHNNVHLIFISSDMVFGGEQNAPFKENDSISANNAYGAMKIAGEQLVSMASHYTIVRTALVYGPLIEAETEHFNKLLIADELENQTLFPLWVATRCLNDLPVDLANNVCCTPTYIDDLVNDLWKIVQQNEFGIMHCSGKGRVSRYDIGVSIEKLLGKENLVHRFTAQTNSIRPLDVSLLNTETTLRLGSKPTDLFEGLRMTIQNTKGLS